MLSTHKAEVVPVVLEPHPNADTLSVVKVKFVSPAYLERSKG